jgi:REP element-mobilizing transposase RayT
MTPQPLYSLRNQDPAYALRYSWAGWASRGDFQSLKDDGWSTLAAAWETDGLRLLEKDVRRDQLLLTFSTTPEVSPAFLATRAKGRLDHAFRTAHLPLEFSRKVAVRSVGENSTSKVAEYIRSQVANEHFVDPRFAELLRRFTVTSSTVDLSIPSESRSGRYWYNLHLVLVVDGRARIVDEPGLTVIRDGCSRIAANKGYRVAAISVMPDHLHLALRGTIEQSPVEIALALQNNLAYMLNRGAIWRNGYYAGTFGEYDMNAIRVKFEQSGKSPEVT